MNLLRPCAENCCEAIGLQETKRDGTSKTVAYGYRAYFSEVEGRKRQHVVGLAIKKESVKKVGKDGIAIECISARLLKARVLIKSNFVAFVVAYAPSEEAPEWQKAKHTAALNSTVASATTRKNVFALTHANARIERRGE